jgi:hypothetical protein
MPQVFNVTSRITSNAAFAEHDARGTAAGHSSVGVSVTDRQARGEVGALV